MKRTGLLLAILTLSAAPLLAVEGDAIVGVWATAPDPEDGQAHVKITGENGTYSGEIIWLEIPVYPPDDEQGMAGKSKVDRENPDESLRARPIIGLEIMYDFEYAGDGKWKGGTIYAPDDGKTYKCKVTLEDDGTLKVRGFIGVSLLGRTEVWTRVATDD
jgi:uncharacterized protein (DUF2147 family)